MDQPPAVAFTAFANVWPRATGNGDGRRPMRHWRWRNFDFFDQHLGQVCLCLPAQMESNFF